VSPQVPPRSLDYRRLNSPLAIIALAILVVAVSSNAISVLASGWMVRDPNQTNLNWLALSLVGGTALYVLGQVLWQGMVDRAEGQLRRDLLQAALDQPVHQLGSQSAGEILDRVDDDTAAMGRLLRGTVWAAGRIVFGAVPVWVAAGITWWPAWFIFPVLGFLVFQTTKPFFPQIAKRKILEEAAWTDHAAAFEEAVAARDDLRTNHGQAFATRRLAELSAEIHRRISAVTVLESNLTLISGLLLHVTLAAVAVVSVWLATQQRLEIGQLVTLFMATALLVGQVSEMVSYLPQIQEGVGAITRIRQLLDTAPEPVGGELVPPGALSIELRDLNFRYDDDDDADNNDIDNDKNQKPASNFALQNLNLNVPAGQTIALVGRTGSGKTTLASLLSRAVEPPAQTVFLGGRDITSFDLQKLRATVGVVTQRTELVAGTLKENITLFADIPDAQVAAAIAQLGLSDWVADLPQGLATQIGPGGTKFSAGEEQLVAFARLLVRDVQVVVLDEATARMDPLTEARVVAASSSLLAGRTGVIVAHRLATIERADLIAVLDRGRIVQQGQREQLAAALGPYRALLEAAHAHEPGLDIADDDLAEPVGSGTQDVGVANPVLAPSLGPRRQGAPTDRPEPSPGPGLMAAVVEMWRAHPRWGLLGAVCFTVSSLAAAQGPVTGYLWGRTLQNLEAGLPPYWLVGLLAVFLILSRGALAWAVRVYALWWIQLLLRIRLKVMQGQTAAHRLPPTPPGEVTARAMDGDRLVFYADRWIDFLNGLVLAAVAAWLARSWLAGLVILAIMAFSALSAVVGRPIAGRSATISAATRAKFGRVLVSALDATRTVKLAARTEDIRRYLAWVDSQRIKSAIFEHRVRASLDGIPILLCYLAAFVGWALHLRGIWDLTTTLLVTSTALGFVWFGIVAGAVVTEAPGVRSWQVATQKFAGGGDIVARPVGADLVSGVASPPQPDPSVPFQTLQLRDFTVRYDDDGTIGAADVNLEVNRGEIVLLLGQVGSGKSAVLAALAGLRTYDGDILWDGVPVGDPEVELRPGRVAYVSQIPRVISGTIAQNISLGHPDRTLSVPIEIAQLTLDVAEAGGLAALVGHRGVKLSGGQAQRLAFARALATGSAVLVADDISSALDAATELQLWAALKAHGQTVVGSTSKAAALALADKVVVMEAGQVVDTGPWAALAATYAHLAG